MSFVTSTAALEAARRYGDEHRSFEQHRDVRVTGNGPVCLRLDGRSFHSFTRAYVHPFDVRIENAMDAACVALLKSDIGVELAYVQSDEITIVIPRDRVPFDGRIEKLLSVPASICAVGFAMSIVDAGAPMPTLPSFDARLLTAADETDVHGILIERQQDALKNAVSMLAHWTLLEQERLTPKAAHFKLLPLDMRERIELCAQMGVPFHLLASGRKLGRVHTYQLIRRRGFNPISDEDVVTTRRLMTRMDPTPDFRELDGLPWAPTRGMRNER